jgi:hypothetical protein
MKYRVKFKCYHYNTGDVMNHSYIKCVDFDTVEEAKSFKERVNKQLSISKKRLVITREDKDITDYEKKYDGIITVQERNDWYNSDNFVGVSNGHILEEAEIVGFYPEKEVSL